MKQIFKDYLFEKHILVSDSHEIRDRDRWYETCFNSLIGLARIFGIRVTKGAIMATEEMIHDAERNLGKYVPEPFYRGFPESVRAMTPDQLIFDQMYHYTQTYGMGWFDQPGHSVFEDDTKNGAERENIPDDDGYTKMSQHRFYQMAFKGTKWDQESSGVNGGYVAQVKEFIILNEHDAIQKLQEFTRELSGSNRPLNRSQMDILEEAWKAYPVKPMLAEKMPCKKTVVTLMYDLRNASFAKHLELSDTMKLVEYIQYKTYGKEKINQLNLKNRDRKFIAEMIHELFRRMLNKYSLNTMHAFKTNTEIRDCFTRRKDWKGLLHHLHFKPINKEETYFCKLIRDPMIKNLSPESEFEYLMAEGKPSEAMEVLIRRKGTGAGLRNLNYILSRCDDEKEIEEVFSCLE